MGNAHLIADICRGKWGWSRSRRCPGTRIGSASFSNSGRPPNERTRGTDESSHRADPGTADGHARATNPRPQYSDCGTAFPDPKSSHSPT